MDHHEELSPKKMRFSQKPSSSSPPPDLRFSCKPNRPNSPCDQTSEPLLGLIMATQKPDHHHNNIQAVHEDVQTILREQKDPSNNGRERLKRHRDEVAGRVVVPERWGMEDRMREWIDYSTFDRVLAPSGVRSAREALVVEAQRRRQLPSSAAMRIEISRC